MRVCLCCRSQRYYFWGGRFDLQCVGALLSAHLWINVTSQFWFLVSSLKPPNRKETINHITNHHYEKFQKRQKIAALSCHDFLASYFVC